jgi:hypothetical protein
MIWRAVRRLVVIAGVLAAVAAAGCGGGESDAARLCKDLTPSVAAKRWRSASHERVENPLGLDGDSPATRFGFEMVRCHTLVGLRRRQVRLVLGPPDNNWRGIWEYDAGPDSQVDNWLVRIRFGPDGRVVSTMMGQS